MDTANLKAIVQHFGENRVIGFMFDNSGRKVFKVGEFTLASILNEELGILSFNEVDISGLPYIAVKPVENVQSIMIADIAEHIGKYDARYMAC